MRPVIRRVTFGSVRAGVIADDLTGALELGALLVAHGMKTTVCIERTAADWNACDAVVIDTESRHLAPEEAAARVRSAVSALRTWGADRMFKKVDSTLRGSIDAELGAFAEDVIFTPAYPALGRVVRDGVVYVHDKPLMESPFTNDPRTRPTSAKVQMRDAVTEDGLSALIRENPDKPFAGSGGLGRAWVASLPKGTFIPPRPSKPRRPLVVCGSRHPVSRAQANQAREHGILVLMTPDHDGNPQREAAMLATRTAAEETDLLILFGGDTACAVLEARGIPQLWPVREMMTGVALSTAREMMIVTKAGGFGAEGIVADILQQLT